MEFTVKIENTNIDVVYKAFIDAVKRFACYAQQEQKNNNIDKANEFYNYACDFVWSAREFKMISIETACDLIAKIAEHRYQN